MTETSRESGRAVAALVLAILALVGVLPCIGGVLAIALAAGERSAVARAALILGVLSLLIPPALLVLFGCFAVPAAVFGAL